MKFISSKAHTVIGLIVGIVLVLAPSLFNFNDTAPASMVAIWVGIFILLNELITTSPFSPLKLIPMKAHIVVDVLTGLFLALSPWLFNFADMNEPSQWVPHLVVGILTAGYALMTTTADAHNSTLKNS
jgi:hypothetical protein